MKQGAVIEKWKFIKGYMNRYQISSFGRVLNVKTGRILKQTKDTRGFLKVSLRRDGQVKTYQVHKLVAEHFIGNKEGFSHIAFLDCNKENVKVSNLEYCMLDYLLDLKEKHKKQKLHFYVT